MESRELNRDEKLNVKLNVKYKIPSELKDVIPGYLGRRDQDIQQLKIAIEACDFTTVGKIAHKLKGNGASYGFDHLTEIGQRLMNASETKNKLAVIQLIQEFEEEVENIKINIL